MSRAGAVISFGSILIDVAIAVPGLPDRGGDVIATGTDIAAGGGFNLAAAVARQGVRCVYAAPHGNGRYGDLVRASLTAEGIACVQDPRTDDDTGFCVTLIEPDGERTFVTVVGVEGCQRNDDLAAIHPTAADYVALSGYDLLYPASGPVLAGWVASADPDTRIALDPGPLIADVPADRLTAVLPCLSMLTVNQREARILCEGILLDTNGTGLAELAGEELLEVLLRHPLLGPSTLVVLREGRSGCLASAGPLGDHIVFCPAPPVHVVDTTGAGDTHTGILLAELVRGTPIDEAVRLATFGATYSVTLSGPATAPSCAELIAFADQLQ